MPVIGFSHMGLTVTEIDRSLNFYCGLLGFELATRWTRDEDYIRALLGFPDLILHAAILRVPGCGSIVELVQYDEVARTRVQASHADPGTCHLSLFVTELDQFASRLRDVGVEFVADPVTPTIGPNANGRAVYILDPDGIRVELTQSPNRLDQIGCNP